MRCAGDGCGMEDDGAVRGHLPTGYGTVGSAASPRGTAAAPRPSRLRAAPLAALLMASTAAVPLLVASTTQLRAAGPIVFDIPTGDLGGVLAQIGRVGAQPISFPADLTRGRRAGPIAGRMGVQEALTLALGGTDLVVVPAAGGTLTVQRRGPVPTGAAAPAAAGDIAAIDVVDANAGSPYGDRGFQAGNVGDTIRIADAPLKETPVAISVVTNETIRSQNVTNTLEAARNSAGVIVTPGATGQPRFIIRGFETSGFSVNGQQNPVTLQQQIPIDAVDRIEVLKGPTAILTGVNVAGGGLINVTLKKPTAETIRDLTIRYGTYNYKTIALDLGGGVPDLEGTTYRFVTSLNHADRTDLGYRDPSEFLVMPSVRWEGQDLTVSAGLRYIQTRAVPQARFGFRALDPETGIGAIYRIPGNGPGNPNSHYDGRELTFETEQNYHAGTLFGLFDVSFNNLFQHQSVRFVGDSFSFFNTNFGFTQSGVQTGFDTQVENISERLSMTLKYQDDFMKSTTKFGFDYLSYWSGARSALPAFLPDFDLYNNTPISPLISGPYDFTVRKSSNIYRGGYMVEKLDLFDNKLHILGMARWDWFNQNSQSLQFGVAETPSVSKNDALSYTFGALLDLPYDLGVYINRSEGRIPQAPVAGISLAPIGRTLNEFGLRSSMFDNRFRTTLSFFELTESPLTLILQGQAGFPEGIRIVNTAGLQSRGIELEGQGEILPGWNLTANVTRLWTRSLDPDGLGLDPSAGRPAYQGSLWTTYTWLSGWAEGITVGAGVRALTEFKVNQLGANSLFTLPGYAVFDAAIGYTSGDFSANLKINNLFDSHAFSLSTISTYLPIERGRHVLLQASYRF